MRPLFGAIKQLGFISRNIDRSMRYFADVWDIGPWFVRRRIPFDSLYRGTPSDITISVALSSAAGMQYEIIEQHDTGPSIYQDVLRAASEGLHVQHVAVWTDEFPKMQAAALAKGWEPVLENRTGPGKSLYLIHPDEPHLCMEISDTNPAKEHFRKIIEDIAATWDGSDPIREGIPKA
jgi:hypothetical protein